MSADLREAIYAWIREDAPPVIKMRITPELVIVLAERLSGPVTSLNARVEELEAECYALKLAAAGGEDAPGAANAVTREDVKRWRKEAE
ncbi:hypothetical protein [Methylobacterium nodulans]|uniref:Uncharacterized protein n=1 Tax=Methylobacterium nodulans (strain LMG 21967 / CNCM I-2342 / ORS 2060) TaxID=460265 RepID=B8IKW6_METNO|nr:hypothetical protein [Methylobacterium nodulans]ACL58154.1 hypothetical protein Mnod_3229 [Methylobacterium nodulans ORS 2060]